MKLLEFFFLYMLSSYQYFRVSNFDSHSPAHHNSRSLVGGKSWSFPTWNVTRKDCMSQKAEKWKLYWEASSTNKIMYRLQLRDEHPEQFSPCHWGEEWEEEGNLVMWQCNSSSVQIEGNKYIHFPVFSHKFIILSGTILCFMWEACAGNLIFNSFSSIKLGWLKVLLSRTCLRPQDLGAVILFFSDPGGAGTLWIYPQQVSGLPKEKTGCWGKSSPIVCLQAPEGLQKYSLRR